MEMRPELNEEAYRKRVTLTDLRVAQLSMFPNLSGVGRLPVRLQQVPLQPAAGFESGIQLSWNLLKLPQWPALKRAIGNQGNGR